MISSHAKISMIPLLSSLSLKLYLNSLVYHRNIFSFSSKVFGNLWKSLEILGKCTSYLSNRSEGCLGYLCALLEAHISSSFPIPRNLSRAPRLMDSLIKDTSCSSNRTEGNTAGKVLWEKVVTWNFGPLCCWSVLYQVSAAVLCQTKWRCILLSLDVVGSFRVHGTWTTEAFQNGWSCESYRWPIWRWYRLDC